MDGEFTVTVGDAGKYNSDEAPDGFDGAGLAILFKSGKVGFAALLPESSNLLPNWYANPAATGESKLSTLAQELSMLLVPEAQIAELFEAARVEQVDSALTTAVVASDAALVPLQISRGEISGQMSLVWPLASPDMLLSADTIEEATPEPTPLMKSSPPTQINNYSQLPPYSRSLLKVKVPVHVVLASKKEKIDNVVELAPGTIIKFDKSCEELLHLHVGNQVVAEGEAVKVGDKFGFRVS
ncbi:MAG: FliM/FliN family flagellar motor switch protein, partial [Pseudomonadales bacterium]